MKIVLAEEQDIPSIVEIAENDGYGRPLDASAIRDYMRRGDQYFLFYDPDPVGVMKLAINADHEAEIFVISVTLAEQRKGIARALLRFAEERVQGMGKNRIYTKTRTDNEKGLAFFRKNGFREVGEIRDSYAPGDRHLLLVKLIEDTFKEGCQEEIQKHPKSI